MEDIEWKEINEAISFGRIAAFSSMTMFYSSFYDRMDSVNDKFRDQFVDNKHNIKTENSFADMVLKVVSELFGIHGNNLNTLKADISWARWYLISKIVEKYPDIKNPAPDGSRRAKVWDTLLDCLWKDSVRGELLRFRSVLDETSGVVPSELDVFDVLGRPDSFMNIEAMEPVLQLISYHLTDSTTGDIRPTDLYSSAYPVRRMQWNALTIIPLFIPATLYKGEVNDDVLLRADLDISIDTMARIANPVINMIRRAKPYDGYLIYRRGDVDSAKVIRAAMGSDPGVRIGSISGIVHPDGTMTIAIPVNDFATAPVMVGVESFRRKKSEGFVIGVMGSVTKEQVDYLRVICSETRVVRTMDEMDALRFISPAFSTAEDFQEMLHRCCETGKNYARGHELSMAILNRTDELIRDVRSDRNIRASKISNNTQGSVPESCERRFSPEGTVV